MKILNPRNLPEAIVNAGTPEERTYTPNRIGVMDLIGPAWQRKLRMAYDGEIEEEIERRFKLIIGTALHFYMDSKAPEGSHTESKLVVKIGDYEVAGIPDIHKDGVMHDYKYTSAWSYVFGKKEWDQQLNIYAYLASQAGFEIKRISILAFFYDWDELQAMRNPDYPRFPILEIPIPLWSEGEQRDFIDKRLDAHINVVPCSPEERWRREPTYAVMKHGQKRAVRVFSTRDEAELYKTNAEPEGTKFPKLSIEERLGEDRRCLQYCPVSAICSENRYLAGGKDENRTD